MWISLTFPWLFQSVQNSLTFPWLENAFPFFQVFQVFQSEWEPCIRTIAWIPITELVSTENWELCAISYFTVTRATRWYPRGIQKLVSTYDLPKLQNCLNFNLGGGEYSGVRTEKYSKCQDLLKFQVSGGYSGVRTKKYSKCQDLLKFQFSGGGEGGLYTGLKYSKFQYLPKFQFRGGGGLWSEIPERGFLEKLDTNFTVWGYCTQTCLCITDSLSHTTYVETNQCSVNDWLSPE